MTTNQSLRKMCAETEISWCQLHTSLIKIDAEFAMDKLFPKDVYEFLYLNAASRCTSTGILLGIFYHRNFLFTFL